MALIRCEDCGHMVSDLAFACPQCARPIAALKAAARPPAATAASGPVAGTDADASAAPPAADTAGAAPEKETPAGSRADLPPRSPVWTADAVAHPVVDAWLEDIRKARQLPAGTKVCKQCKADVALDTFRQKFGNDYLCSECWDKSQARITARQKFVRKVAIVGTVVAVGVAVTAGAITVGPTLLAPRTTRHR